MQKEKETRYIDFNMKKDFFKKTNIMKEAKVEKYRGNIQNVLKSKLKHSKKGTQKEKNIKWESENEKTHQTVR